MADEVGLGRDVRRSVDERAQAREVLLRADLDRQDSRGLAGRVTQDVQKLSPEGKRDFFELLDERRAQVQGKLEAVERRLENLGYADSREGRSLKDDRASLRWDKEHLETISDIVNPMRPAMDGDLSKDDVPRPGAPRADFAEARGVAAQEDPQQRIAALVERLRERVSSRIATLERQERGGAELER